MNEERFFSKYKTFIFDKIEKEGDPHNYFGLENNFYDVIECLTNEIVAVANLTTKETIIQDKGRRFQLVQLMDLYETLQAIQDEKSLITFLFD